MMSPEEIFNGILELQSRYAELGRREPQTVEQLRKLHLAAFGERLEKSCGNCITKAYFKISRLTLQNLIDMSEKQFKLKKDALLSYKGDHYTNANLTDKVAAEVLEKYPKMAKMFESTPAGFEPGKKSTPAKPAGEKSTGGKKSTPAKPAGDEPKSGTEGKGSGEPGTEKK
ncbi:hypothetical protein FW774_05870 [Pedobacter sp. BS3]|uniref:hypothetical protein n=1 Tax=Pedobacter sp. BS3 TaxID=2567937 RepID=UPI0011EFE179|nr:hypothetical protein [Pedobacter sp. BS3]TZF84514.1 hypothetical protein FW774_05870 [Pedobacter sp. BS3]